MLKIDELKFDEKGLIPAIVVDAENGKVLTLAYMNRESLRISMEKGLTCFWSRSRQELWLKGETSGNYQHVVSITADCDRDALVVEVVKDGPACHLGTDSCFNDLLYRGEQTPAFQYADLRDADNAALFRGEPLEVRGFKAERFSIRYRLTGCVDDRAADSDSHSGCLDVHSLIAAKLLTHVQE